MADTKRSNSRSTVDEPSHAPLTRGDVEDAVLMDRTAFTYSVVIPVFNSEAIVGETIDRVIGFFEDAGLKFELILINDGSRDGSWRIVKERAVAHSHIIALNLLHNSGQHKANLAGLREATGDYVITMDDDLQNPPDQIGLLIDEAMTGKDAVFGKFERKQAAGYRALGSKAIGLINRRIFGQPPDLTVTNFRILRRDVVDRICASRTAYPYITGQALLYSSNRSNVTVRHDPRPVGDSSYGFLRIAKLVATILFSYSSFPLRLAALFGFLVSAFAFVIGVTYLILGAVGTTRVEGWTSLIVLLAFFNGVTIALLSMLGEYTIRTLNSVSANEPYHVVERVGG
jgi:polyisoprenyl-phosphate glycosyltransferase